ncbi:MAG: hypothetical protein J6J66_01545 [Clostridia bacterium]|nr:hypothetical protein [Clostridia bacterium]
MKNAKKIVLLLLSLVLLCGVFAVAALAEEPASTATVVYPDGSVDAVAVGDTIVPKAFTDGLYYGAGNTLYKDDATEGWSFTLDGAALTDLTVTDAMAGKKIIASGADKVYSVIDIHLGEGDYYKWIEGSTSVSVNDVAYYTVLYVKAGESGSKTYNVYAKDGTTLVTTEKTVEYSTTKRVAGDYKVFFYDDASLQKFFTTSASIELGGVSLNYQDLRHGSDTTHKVTLYADHTVGKGFFDWEKNGYDRPRTSDGTNVVSASTGAAKVYFDLNGHSLVNTTAAVMELRGLTLYLYSTKPGAHYIHTTAATAFYVSDDCTLALGNNAENGEYARNLNLHVNQLFAGHYGSGAYIYGGNYYQAEGTGAYLANVARRVNAVKHANFYVKDGVAVFGEASAYNGNTPLSKVVILDCNFYSNGSSPVFLSAGKGTASLQFKDCTFNGVTATLDASAGTVTDVSGNTFNGAAVTYKTVTFADGTTEYYYATTLDEAKTFVGGHYKAATPAPYGKYVDGKYYVALNPTSEITYDDAFNAVQTIEDGALTRVYYTVTKADGTVEYYTGTDYANSFKAYLANWEAGATVTLYENVAMSTTLAAVCSTNGGNAYLDLNGYTWSVTTASSLAMDVGPTSGKAIYLYLYSSVPGGKISVPSAKYFLRTNSYGTVYFGERDTSKTEYGKNLTVECRVLNGDLYGNGIGIYGGTYVQVAGSADKYIVNASRTDDAGASQFKLIRNATFIINKADSFAIHYLSAGFTKIADCTFVSTVSGATAIGNQSSTALTQKVPSFVNCDFINVLPVSTLGNDKNPIYENCRFSLSNANTDAYSVVVGGAAEQQYLARVGAGETITYAGEEYPVNYAFAKSFLTVVWTDGTHPYWALGSKPLSDTSLGDTIEKQADGSYKVFCDSFWYPVGYETVAEAHLGLTATELSVAAGRTIPLAFSYQVDGGKINYVELLATPEENGEQFAAILNDKFNVKIVMYTDIVLNRGVLFGTLMDKTDPKGKTVQVLNQSGNVDWDLNGMTVTVAASASPLAMANERESQGAQIINVLHYVKAATFKLYSSVEGGKYINNSKHAIFGGLKYTDSASSYILGTSDLAVNGGDNLTLISNGTITAAYENQANGPAGVMLGINGGTYVYNGTGAAFNTAAGTTVKNAKIATTGAALSVFINQFWSSITFYAENITVGCASKSTYLVESGTMDNISTSTGKTYSVSLNGVLMAGGTLNGAYKSGACTFTIEGTVYAGDEASLAVAYPTAPEGKALAYTSVAINGVYYKYLGYYEAPTTVNVKNEITGEVEAWLVGSVHVAAGDISALNVVEIDGKLYYRPNPTWSYVLDGAPITDPCAAENAGKTVSLNVGGETVAIFAIYDVSGAKTYYYGNVEDYNAELLALIAAAKTANTTLTLYEDITLTAAGVQNVYAGSGVTFKIDLNGYKLTLVTPHDASYALKFSSGSSYIYSSREGGVLDAGASISLVMTDGGGNAYFGELDAASTAYGKNLTVICKRITSGRLWSNNAHILGGTYVQPEGEEVAFILGIDAGPVPTVQNSTFVVKSVKDALIRRVAGTFTNCTFIAENATNLFIAYDSAENSAATFKNCYFYNVVPNVIEGATVTYTDCHFDKPSSIPQAGGYIAGTATDVSLTVLGETYKFCAKLLAADLLTPIKASADTVVYFETASFEEAFAQGKFVTVDWGFGLDMEYWALGALATHENVTVDEIFVYAFAPIQLGNMNMTAYDTTLVNVLPGKILLGLSAANNVTYKVYIPKDAGYTDLTVGGIVRPLNEYTATEGDYYVIEVTVSPSQVAQPLYISLKATYEHGFNTGFEQYANAVLADEAYAGMHKLVYAMVEYVELMSGTDMDVTAPEGYAVEKLVAAASTNAEGGSLAQFSFCHDSDLIFGLTGTAGTKVVLSFSYDNMTTGSYTIAANGTVAIYAGSVYELADGFTFTCGQETEVYTYSLANYLYELENAEVVDATVIAKLQALYNYAYYAKLFVAAQ